MKRMFSIVILLMVMMLAACGVPNPSSKETSKESGTKTEPKTETKEITIAANGGKIEKLIRDDLAPKFKEKYGIMINFVAGSSNEILTKVQLQKDNPQIDIAMYDSPVAVRAEEEGLTEAIAKESIKGLDSIDERYLIDEHSVPVLGYSVAVGYNTDIFKEKGWKAISSWNDLISSDYKGMTAFPDVSSNSGFTMFLSLAKANGGGIENMQPGMDKGKELAAYSDTFYKNSTQIQPAMQQGAAVTVQASYTIAGLHDAGVPVKMVIPKEGAPLQAIVATVVKNSPNKKAAEDFINFMVTVDSQKKIAEIAFYPVVKSVKLPENYDSIIGFKDSDPVYKPDFAGIAKIQPEWTEKWTKEVTPELGKKVKK
ncbi:extracellular solute-binding protein [Neobacillus sp. SAB-20_R2A]|uniref:extracellular solute-binding protein n=1 Tax=Neobacillus sp. SAB-20_R2A TaxID=3120519 RepID=UPI003C6E450D